MLFFPATKLPFDTGTGKYFSRFVIKHLHLCCSHAQRSAVALHPMNASSVWEIQSSTSLQAEGWISVCVYNFLQIYSNWLNFSCSTESSRRGKPGPKAVFLCPRFNSACGQVGHTVPFEEWSHHSIALFPTLHREKEIKKVKLHCMNTHITGLHCQDKDNAKTHGCKMIIYYNCSISDFFLNCNSNRSTLGWVSRLELWLWKIEIEFEYRNKITGECTWGKKKKNKVLS